MLTKKSLSLFACTALIATSTFAAPSTVIAPLCLLKAAKLQLTPLAVKNNLQLVTVNDQELDQLAAAKHTVKNCSGFINVSAAWSDANQNRQISPSLFLTKKTAHTTATRKPSNYKIQYQKETNEALKNLNPQNIWSNLTTLTSFKDRYANSSTGVEAAAWIKQKIETIAKETGHENDVTVYYVQTGSYKQPSVVAKFGHSAAPGIVLGAHMDTLKSMLHPLPGADDDGSGSSTLMETARTLLASGQQFKKPIYFIWYSAEELGLIGSGYVVTDFKAKKIPVDAVLQMDMTGYENQNSPTIWLMTDYVDPALTSYLEKLIETYVKKPFDRSACGYGCSDHANWTDANIPAAFPFEARMNDDDPEIHTANDKMDLLSLDHMTDFAKLGTAFAVELAEPAA